MTDANPKNDDKPTQPAEPAASERTFTQADIDAAINARLKDERKKHAEELAKFANYEDLQAKAAKYDELEAAKKSEVERANEAAQAATKRAEAAEAKAARLEADKAHAELVSKVAGEEDVPANLLSGEDEDDLRASAQALKAFIEANKPTVPETKAGGATPAPDDENKLSEREEFAFRVR